MLKTKSTYVGIDPGFKRCGIGAVSCNEGKLVYFSYLEDWTPNDLYFILAYLKRDFYIHKVGVEHVHTMKDQGISSSGKFMKATGIIIGTLNGMRIPYVEITPQKWKSISPILKAEKDETRTQKKARSLTYVNDAFPDSGFNDFKARKAARIDMADAIGIAVYMYENSL